MCLHHFMLKHLQRQWHGVSLSDLLCQYLSISQKMKIRVMSNLNIKLSDQKRKKNLENINPFMGNKA